MTLGPRQSALFGKAMPEGPAQPQGWYGHWGSLE